MNVKDPWPRAWRLLLDTVSSITKGERSECVARLVIARVRNVSEKHSGEAVYNHLHMLEMDYDPTVGHSFLPTK